MQQEAEKQIRQTVELIFNFRLPTFCLDTWEK